LLRRRFSCRAFQERAVDGTLVERVLDAARWAPSAGNLQPWRFVVATAPHVLRRLASAAYGQASVAQAPIVVAVCAVPDESARTYGDLGRELYCVQDTAAATQTLLLAATAEGLGSCWVGAFRRGEVARCLELPPSWWVVSLVCLGWPAEDEGRRSRRPLEEIVLWRDG
jgi:nitroreductase